MPEYTDNVRIHGHEDAPAGMRDGLKSLHALPDPVPPEIDDAILNAGYRQMAANRRRRTWAWVGVAAAACVAISTLSSWLPLTTPMQTPVSPTPIARSDSSRPGGFDPRKDIDSDGRVDILDAFTLARRIEGGAALPSNFDLNGDGMVDQRDVDAVALAAVRIKGGA